mgnify:CR=1 FL=1
MESMINLTILALVSLLNIFQTSWLEAIAVCFGILSVWYAKKANVLVYPTGIISVLIYVYICHEHQLYADMGINLFYFAISIYGWHKWTRKSITGDNLPISWNTPKQQISGILLSAIFFVAIFGLIYVFKKTDTHYIESYVPYIDSFTTAIFLTAMLLMAKKRVENWIYWTIGNIVSIPLYFSKGLYFTSFQFAVFLALSIAGYFAWKRMYLNESNSTKKS